MSGYSPTWTNKGSDKLRALQATKILMNSLEKIIASFDVTNRDTEHAITSAIADAVFNFFTPHRDLGIEEQFDLLMESLGWKNIRIEKNEDNAVIQLGANRFIASEATYHPYLVIVSGIMKALGYFLFNSDARVEQMPSQFESQQLQIIIQKVDNKIPTVRAQEISTEPSMATSPAQTKTEGVSGVTLQPSAPVEEKEIKASLDLDLDTVFSPILKEYPTTMVLPLFHKVLAEITSTFFSDIEDSNVKKAKEEFNDIHVLFLIEFLLINIRDSEQDIKEISSMIGQYVTKALQAKATDDLKNYLPADIISSISRRVAYVEYPARTYCTYAPGEKCVEGKRDLCDFVLYIWEGILTVLLPESNFKVGERIPSTRRGKFCLVEFLRNE
ncbi:MAG: hypothetical protein GPJ51_09840 [Candidatus Heimdallarchaeota archaeon]|nr:hypothetical protein [Candidatus Heimdallarchaeota archaeon]